MEFHLIRLEETTSTNDAAAQAADSGADDGLVIWARRQLAGRGQKNRRWESQPACSLTFSVLFRPTQAERRVIGRFTALGALAVAEAVKCHTGFEAQVKWPNDVLLHGKKICGVLTEADLRADGQIAVVVGVGVNLLPGAFADGAVMNYPASDLFTEAGVQADPETMLWRILNAIRDLRRDLTGEGFIRKWNERLAFRGELRMVRNHKGETRLFRLLGVLEDGSLAVEDEEGQPLSLQSAEVLPSSSAPLGSSAV